MNKLFINHTIGDIISMVEKNKISSQEVENASLDNIKSMNKKYFPWVVYGDKKTINKEKQENSIFDSVPRPKLLAGIPIGVKDIFNTADYPTQMGSPLWKNFTPGNDARSVFNLRRQGAIVIGKTVTAEFAVHTLLNKTLNPYDPTKNTGTSSTGSAVAVALGMVPLATGTQTAGSIIRPASFCGVYGCKPSFGTIPRTGTLKTTDSLDTLGFLTIHQKDLKRAFDSMNVLDKDHPIANTALNDITRQNKSKYKPWRVGFVKTHTWENTPQYAKKSLEDFMKHLSKQNGIDVAEAILPKSMTRSHEIHSTIYNKTLSYYFKEEYQNSKLVSPIMNNLIENGQKIKLEEYLNAINDQNNLIRNMDIFFKDYDVIISLSTAGEAPPREIVELPDPCLMWTLTHLPVVGVPAFTSPSNLPFGMQIAARKYNDYLLFSFIDDIRERGLIPEKSTFFK